MKILQINTTFGGYSIGSLVRDVHNELNSSEKFDCTSIVLNNLTTQKKKVYSLNNFESQKIASLYSRISGWENALNQNATQKIIKKIDEISPEIIHLHNIHSNFLNFEYLFKYLNRTNIKVVLTNHDCWYFTGKCTHFVDVKCDKWTQKCGNCPKLRDDIPSYIFDRTESLLNQKIRLFGHSNIVAFVSLSQWMENKYLQSAMYKKTKIPSKLIPNWYDDTCFKPLLSIKKMSNKLIAISNEWNNGKGINELIALSNELEKDYKLILVGNKPKNISKSNIEFIGRVDSKENLNSLLNGSLCLLNLSMQESFGLVNIESIASGTKVIAIKGGAADHLINEETGFLVNGELTDIKRAIKKIAETKNTDYDRAKIGEQALKYTKKTVMKNLFDFYGNI